VLVRLITVPRVALLDDLNEPPGRHVQRLSQGFDLNNRRRVARAGLDLVEPVALSRSPSEPSDVDGSKPIRSTMRGSKRTAGVVSRLP
jgi:hypothetical protein